MDSQPAAEWKSAAGAVWELNQVVANIQAEPRTLLVDARTMGRCKKTRNPP